MRPLLGRLGGYLPAAIALALPIVFIPNLVDEFILPRASIVIVGACLGAGVALLAPGGPGLGRLRWPLFAAAGAAILAFVFSISWPLSFAGSYSRYESLPVRLGYLGLLAVPVWLLRDSRPRNWVVPAFVFGTTVVSLEALMQSAAGVSFRPDGNTGNANLLGALIAVGFPLAVARGFRGDRFVVAWWLGAAVMAGGLVVSTSRSGGLGALAGCLALAVFAFRRRLWVATSAIVSSGLLLAGLWLIVLGPLSLLNNDPARSRLQLWPDALRMIATRPVTGWGEDATGLAFGRFVSADWAPGIIYDRTHSGILETAATQGILGLATIGLVLVILFRGTWRWRFAGDVGALTAACIGYTVWVVFNFDWAPATGVFWLLAGTAWSAVRAAESDAGSNSVAAAPATPGPAFWRTGVAIGLALLAIGLAAFPLLADVWYRQGRVDLSVVVDPLQSRYHWALGQGLVAQGSVERGVDEMRRAADLGETDPSLYVELGDREAELGRTADARRHYQRALEIDPYYAPAKQRLAALGS
ncbi:MAG TPA: O-antigen ligase family protein [Candidatus Dormibacteraeota bacterium]|jgi:O-antigen ligase